MTPQQIQRERPGFRNRQIERQERDPDTEQHERVPKSPKKSDGGGGPHRGTFGQDCRQRGKMVRV